MIDLKYLAELADRVGPALAQPVSPVRLYNRVVETFESPLVQGVVNLSRDSTYRASISPNLESAVRRSRIAWAEGADFIDLGAESSSTGTRRVSEEEQLELLAPAVRAILAEGIPVSVEAHSPTVIAGTLAAGARIINYTGSASDQQVFRLAADHGATLILTYQPRANARDSGDLPTGEAGLALVRDSLELRAGAAIDAGVECIVLDPGVGFSYGNTEDPVERIRLQTEYILNSGHLRGLGHPVLQSLPNGFATFQEYFMHGEAYFAVLARIAGADIFRVHEVGQVAAVLRTMLHS